MDDSTTFVELAQQHGYTPAAARHALATIAGWLSEQAAEPLPTDTALSFYIFRTGGTGGAEGSPPPARPRTLLAFASADAALAFAQRSALGNAPRLLRLSLPRLLAALIQRPAISALIFVDDLDEPGSSRGLPAGLRLERATLINLLQ